MIIEPSSSDRAVLIELGSRISQHRLAHNQSQAELSRAAGISKRTLERLEAGESTQLTNFIRVVRALDLGTGLNALIPAPTPSPIELLKFQGKQRKRASSVREPKTPTQPWVWNDSK
jgi:putative transcriptional regulator